MVGRNALDERVAGGGPVTAPDVSYLDRTLPDAEGVRDALATLGESLPDERLARLCRVLYPAVRVRLAYQPRGDPESVAGHADVLLDGLDAGHEPHLARFADAAASPVSVSLSDHYRLGTDSGVESVLALPFERSERTAATRLADRLSGADPDDHRDRLGLPDDFAADGPVAVGDATQVYLPFWVAEFADGSPASDRVVALRDVEWIGQGGSPRDERWLSKHVADDPDLLSRVRSVERLPPDEEPAADPGSPASDDSGSTPDDDSDPAHSDDSASTEADSDDAELTVPDDVELSVSSILEANPGRRFADVGGMDDLKATLRDLVVDPLERPEQYERYGLGVTNGVLFHGPPGCGKTYLAGALAGELDRHFLSISPSDLTSKWVGEAADNVADVFEVARANAPCLVFIDEIDAVASDRSGQMTNTEQQMVNQLLTELEGAGDDDVVVLAATNLVEDVDDAILRSGRFDERVEVSPPDAAAREAILEVHLAGRPTTADLSLSTTIERTAGYASSDLELVAERAARAALAEDADIAEDHLLAAVAETETSIPSWLDRYDFLDSEVAADEEDGIRHPPNVSLDPASLLEAAPSRNFDAVPGMTALTETLRERVLDHLERPDRYESYNVDAPDGVLLYGPPECGKTFLSRAMAGELDRPYLRITPTKLLVEWEGSPADNVADAFEVARANAPCVVFVDDLDALAPDAGDVGRRASRALTHALAAELDSTPPDVFVVGATHLVEDVTDHVLHAGCFDERVEVPPPDEETCEAVLRTVTDDHLLGAVEWDRVAERATGATVGDLRRAANSAARVALREDRTVTTDDLLAALESVGSSIAGWHERGRYADSEYGSDLRYIS